MEAFAGELAKKIGNGEMSLNDAVDKLIEKYPSLSFPEGSKKITGYMMWPYEEVTYV